MYGYVTCSIMGAGRDRTEMLPVKEAPVSFRGGSRATRTSSPEDGTPTSVSEQHYSGGEAGASNASSTSSSIFVKIDDKGVFADICAISGCEPNWPHFIFVGKVKSAGEEPADFSEAAKTQLKREMLGLLLHQTGLWHLTE